MSPANGPVGPLPHGPARPGAADSQEARLRKVAQQMEGVFVDQLFKAMRETVPQDGLTDGGPGEEMFQGMMDEHLAGMVPRQWEHGLGEALFRQLRGALQAAPAGPTATPGSGDSQ